MHDKIYLNKEPYMITESDLPCLVTYKSGMGGSHLTVTLVSDLALRGSKIIFFTAYPMAGDNFLKQIGTNHSNIAFINSISDLKSQSEAQILILESGNEQLFIDVVNSIPDLQERIVLIKNIEMFTSKVFENCFALEKIILSGDIDNCIAKEKISKLNLKTLIAFNQPEINLPIKIGTLEKYIGYLQSDKKSGNISVKIN